MMQLKNLGDKMSKCIKCKKGDMHPVDVIIIINQLHNEYIFLCDKCGKKVVFEA